ncbi:hypothetical protein O0L34_g8875 [Tuta absoluta]|nr:hypothetical protein O0L34_g8875 [Tuta absoluta]
MCKGVKTVTWESEALMGTPKSSRWEQLCPRAALSHVGLFVALMLYTGGGGLVSHFVSELVREQLCPRAALSHVGLFVALMLYTGGGGLVSHFVSELVREQLCPRAALSHVGLFVALMLYTGGGGLVSHFVSELVREQLCPRAALSHVGLFVALMLYTGGGGLVSHFVSELVREQLCPRAALSHVGLFVALMLYTGGGGLVFRALEYPAEVAKQEFHRERLRTERDILIQVVSDRINASTDLQLKRLFSEQLSVYEKVLEEASSSGLVMEIERNFPPAEEKWSILQAVFFSSTVLTTIGYGNIVPETFWGRLFCIVYALVGIPLTLTVIADLGRVFATVVSIIAKHLPEMPKCCSKVSEASAAGQRSFYALWAVGFLFLYLSAGAGLFKMWEDDWSFYDGFYFCFITMTTIGFGDLVPKRPKYMLLCTLYILIGLALTSTIIELVRRQYARSWQQLRALSGPLADHLRRLGHGSGVDVSALQKVLTVVTMPRMGGGRDGLSEKRQLEWEAAVEAVLRDITAPVNKKPPIVQIVIYESSV